MLNWNNGNEIEKHLQHVESKLGLAEGLKCAGPEIMANSTEETE